MTFKIKFLVFLVGLLFVRVTQAFDPFTVEDIRLEGVQRTDPGAIFVNLNFTVGDVFDEQRSSEVIRKLFDTGFFKDVRLGVDGATVVITVVERPAIFKISVSGSKVITEEQALQALSDMGLKESEILDRSILDMAEQELKKLYIAQGKYGVEVVSTITPIERNRVAISFDVFEGRKARIKSITIFGNDYFSDKDLLSEMSLYSGGIFGLFPGAEEYSRQKLEGDLENIRSLYLDKGFVDFRIDETQVKLSADKEDVFLAIRLTEGQRFRFGELTVSGDTNVEHSELQKLIDIKSKEIFSRKRLTEIQQKIESRLGSEGYANAKINAIPQRDAESNTISFALYVNSGERIYVRRIDIVGNVTTRDEVIRRELRQLEGSWYSVADINRSKQRLDLLGFFSEVQINTKPVNGLDNQVDLEVSVTERQTGSFSVGLGYSNLDGLLLQASLNQQNFLGTGNALGLSLQSGRVNETYAVSFKDPYVTDEGVSRTTTISKKDVDVTSLVVSSFQSSTYSANISFGVPVTEYDRIFYGAGVEDTELTIFSNSPTVYQEFVDRNGNNNTVYPLTLGWSRDRRDSSFYPTEGVAQKVNLELSTPVGDLAYYSGQYTAEWYEPLSKNTTLHLEGSVSYSEDFDNDVLPFYKNYYAGGGRTVRGYQTSSIGPKNEFGESVGGKRRILGTGEWLFPLPGLEKDRSMRLALFLDAGGVENSFDDTLSEMRYSTGLGFLWFSPLGPMRFSFAKTLNDEVTDRTEQFQFTLGTTF